MILMKIFICILHDQNSNDLKNLFLMTLIIYFGKCLLKKYSYEKISDIVNSLEKLIESYQWKKNIDFILIIFVKKK